MPDENFIRLLNDNHSFPEMMTFKVIGTNSPEFVAAVLLVVREVLRVHFEPRHTLRVTPNQRHVAITIQVTAGSAELLALTYERLAKVEGTKIVL